MNVVKAILVDSDILIEVARGRDELIIARWQEMAASDAMLLCSPVTVAELWHGARPSEYKPLTALFAAIVCVPIDAETGRKAGDFLRQYAKSHSVELGDSLIAAAASIHKVPLWTRNRRHYPMHDVEFF